MTFLAVWSFIKGIAKAVPLWVWLVLAVAIAFFAYGEYRDGRGYDRGSSERQALWDAASTLQEQALREAQDKQAKVTIQTVTEYVDRVKTVYVKGDTIIKRIPQYVPANTPDLPGGWRLLHDAAASGTELPEAPGSIQAEPVSAQAAAETVAGNYTGCHAELEKLKGLWDWSNGVAGSSGGSR